MTTELRALGAALLMLLLCAAPAHAGDEAASRQHYEKGRALVKLGDHRGAIREFELAYQANPKPNLLYNIAQQHRILSEAGALEEMRLSVDFFERYLREKPNADDRTKVQEYLEDLRKRIASAQAAQQDTHVAGAQPAGPRAVPVEAVTPPQPSQEPAAAPAKKGMPGWAWAVVGVGAAALVGGAVGLGVGLSQASLPGSSLGDGGVRF